MFSIVGQSHSQFCSGHSSRPHNQEEPIEGHFVDDDSISIVDKHKIEALENKAKIEIRQIQEWKLNFRSIKRTVDQTTQLSESETGVGVQRDLLDDLSMQKLT